MRGRGTSGRAVRSPATRVNAGFTLIEMMLALVLIAALAALMVPSFDAMVASVTPREVADLVVASVHEGGVDAERRGEALRVVARPDAAGTWSVYTQVLPLHEAAEGAAAAQSADANGATTDPNLTRKERRVAVLPKGYSFAAPRAEADVAEIGICVLWPNGEATGEAGITLVAPDGRVAAVSVRTLTARCVIAAWQSPDVGPQAPAKRAPVVGAPEEAPAETGSSGGEP
ncbi:MAG: prepilin-type N-terminal cleavage/methylation domain-containing protein [Planctomycetes bacterium]|nr:prepilin-type N-terminal cleavage/methylation domain-containing protein [Planctomycetota bacterium]